MKKVLIVASDRNELKLFGDDYEKCICGVGPVFAAANAMKAAIECKAEVIVSVGSACSLGALEKGNVVSFSSVVCPDQDLTAMHLALGTTIDNRRTTVGALETDDRKSPYTIASSASFTSSLTEGLKALRADSADMEAYGVGIAARILNIPFFVVKVITDDVGDKSSIGDISFILREGRQKMLEKVRSLLEEA